MPALESYDALAARTVDTADIKRPTASSPSSTTRAFRRAKGRAEALDKVSEAYDVLSNPARRAIYDQYGERGLKEGVPDGKGGVKGGKYRFSNNAVEIFTTFFGTSSPFADILAGESEFYGELTGMQLPFAKTKAAPVTAVVEVTLAEVYNGADKTVSYTRKKPATTGHDGGGGDAAAREARVGGGLVATLEGLGDEGVHVLPGDVEIEMVIADDPLWSRDDAALQAAISLTRGALRQGLPTFDGRLISVPVVKIVAPGDMINVPGEGLVGGDFVLYDIAFPKTLTPEQKKAINPSACGSVGRTCRGGGRSARAGRAVRRGGAGRAGGEAGLYAAALRRGGVHERPTDVRPCEAASCPGALQVW